jgi:putative ABC transport system permease protein
MKPTNILKGTFKAGKAAGMVRSALVIFQFSLSIFLIIGTLVAYNQLYFLRNTHLGFDKTNLLYMPVTGDLHDSWPTYSAFRSELSRSEVTKDFTVSWGLPTNYISTTVSFEWPSKDPDYKPSFSVMGVDEHFVRTMGLELVAGRNFSDDPTADSANLIVNETALMMMGLDSASALSRSVTLWESTGKIIGIVKDFNFNPLREPVDPMLLKLDRAGDYLIVRTKVGQLEETISILRKLHRELNPDYIFSFDFLDSDLRKLYQSEQRTGIILNVFALVAIVISCMGLYGLAAFTADQRTKEIAVRKVLGASVVNIVQLLGGYFIRLTLIAFVITIPIAWWATNRWLEAFAYHVSVEIWMFAVAGIVAIFISLLTVSIQTFKAALTNPTESLRTQ